MNRKLLLWTLLLLALECGAGALLWPQLPVRVATHWNAAGAVNGWSSRWTLLISGPVILALLGGLYTMLKKLSSQLGEREGAQQAAERVEICILLFLTYTHGVMLWAATGRPINVGHEILYGVCLLIILLGNLRGKVDQDFYVGFRTPWTLASKQVWNATNRFGAWSMLAGGVLGAAATARNALPLAVALLLVGTLLPIPYSLVYSKRLEARGELQLDPEQDLGSLLREEPQKKD